MPAGGSSAWATSNPQVGSGSGGSILIVAKTVNAGVVHASGGARGVSHLWNGCSNYAEGQRGGFGGNGRIRIEYEAAASAISTTPAAVTQTKTIAAPKHFAWRAQVVDDNTVKVKNLGPDTRSVRVVVTAFK
jgi:hypothetical protein